MENNRKIFYFCYDHQRPSGGQKQMYRHVDILNKNGYQAYAVHKTVGFRLIWFENETKVISRRAFNRLYNKKTDYLVFPEDLGNKISLFAGKKIIFNQNIYYGFNVFGFNKTETSPYLDKDVKFVMTVSSHNERYLKFIFPNVAIRRVYNGIDSHEFTYKSLEQKKKIIVLVPGKSPFDAKFLFQALSVRAKQKLNRLNNYKWELLGTRSAGKTAQILNQAIIFVFPSIYEGFGVIPLEAMLSGAIVVAYKGAPYTEYLNNTNSFLVDMADKLQLVKTLEEIVVKFESNRQELIKISKKALEAARRYSLEREEKSIIKLWKEVVHST